MFDLCRTVTAMSDSTLMLNLDFSNDGARDRNPAGGQKKKERWFPKKRRYLKQHGCLKDKQNCNQKKRQMNHGHAPPRLNGASTKHPPFHTFTHNKSSPPSTSGTSSCSSTAGPSRCSSKPSTSTHSQSSSTVSGSTSTSTHSQSSSTVSGSTAVSNSQKPTSTQKSTGNPSKYLAIDCEMVGTGPKGRISQLARCSVVSYDGDVVYDKFIKPSVPVTDYRTRWSGIRPRDLYNAPPFAEARKEVLKLLMGKVVIGHAIHNDFKALSYTHPAALTRDTSRIPLLNAKAGIAVRECASLKRLTKAIFNRDIQTGKKGHSSVEDAQATMELYKVVEEEWERELLSKSQCS